VNLGQCGRADNRRSCGEVVRPEEVILCEGWLTADRRACDDLDRRDCVDLGQRCGCEDWGASREAVCGQRVIAATACRFGYARNANAERHISLRSMEGGF
jgi:hypothetical protein